MAENKKSVLLYCDIIHTVEKMDNETAGLLFKHYLRYINDQNPKTDNIIVDISFEPIKQQLKRDLKKWEVRAENSRENGKLGGRPKKNPTEPKKPNGLIDNPTEPKKPDTVTVTDTVIVKDNVKVKDISKKQPVYSNEVHECFNNCLKYFDNHLHPENEKKKNNWLDTIEKLNRIEKIPFELIEKITSETRKNEFWAANFLSMTKLRKTNPDGIKYIKVFNEQNKRNQPATNQESIEQRLKNMWSNETN